MKKLTVTVGIPTFNEEKNIETLLTSILRQKRDTFVLKEIIVYSDASTDNTNDTVAALEKKHNIIKLIKGSTRRGKYVRVNTLFTLCKNDVLVILDADIGLVGNTFLEKLVQVLSSDEKALLVAAHQKMLRPKTFIGKIIYAHFLVWDHIRWSIPHYDSARNYYGSATAYRGSFARSVTIPFPMGDPHFYIYLSADSKRGFRYCPTAEMVQWSISTIPDFNKFLRRSIGKRDERLVTLFGEEHIRKARVVHWKYKCIGILKAFREEPIYTPLSFFMNVYVKFASTMQNDTTATWDIVSSTKKIITD